MVNNRISLKCDYCKCDKKEIEKAIYCIFKRGNDNIIIRDDKTSCTHIDFNTEEFDNVSKLL